MRKIEAPEEPWDIGKIIATVATLILCIFGGIYIKQNFFDVKQSAVKGTQSHVDEKDVKTSSESAKQSPISYPNLQTEIQKRISQVKNEADNLSITEIASSSPQIQKILNDIKSLQNYPGNKAREICENFLS